MKFIYKFSLIFSVFFFCNVCLLHGQITITPNNPGGLYVVGETVTWHLQMDSIGKLDSIRYDLKKGGLNSIKHSLINFKDNSAEISYTFNEPGSILLDVRWGNVDTWKNKAVGGAIASADKLKLSSKKPADFDLFWDSKLKELETVPTNPILTKTDSNKEGVDYWKIKMDNIRGTKIKGQIAKPAVGEKFPALLIVQWAGIYPLNQNWVTGKAKDGWLVLNINPHDLPIDNEKQFYVDQSKNDLNQYWSIGNEDKEESYFLRMYLSCYRAAQYLSERPDWNGETLVVMGDSQGGQQTLMTAGFHPKITAALALVPAGFDNLGPEVNRKGGWPQWYANIDGKDAQKVHKTSTYYDVANFVTNIKCPILVGIGLLDETCPPEGVLAGLNQISDLKEVIILPKSGHNNRNGSQDYYTKRKNIWLKSLVKGKDMLTKNK